MNPLLPGQIMGSSPTIKHRNRPVAVDAPTGSLMTTYSMGFRDKNGDEVLVPTIVGGKRVSPDEAIAHYYATGEHFGKFEPTKRGIEASDRMGNLVHEDQVNEELISNLLRSFRF